MRITITSGVKGEGTTELLWQRDLPGDLDKASFGAGTLVLCHVARPGERLPIPDDWMVHETTIEDVPVRVYWVVAATMSELGHELQNFTSTHEIRKPFISYAANSLEELLWLRDGDCIQVGDGTEVYQVRLGLRDDDTWGICLERMVTTFGLENTPYNQELAYRTKRPFEENHSPYITFRAGVITRMEVKAYPAVIIDGEVVELSAHSNACWLIEPHVIEQFDSVRDELEAEKSANPYWIAWAQVSAINGNFGWAQRWQAHRIKTESWVPPVGMVDLGQDEQGDILLLNLGYLPSPGDQVEVKTYGSLRDYLMEQHPEGNGKSRLEYFSQQLGYTLQMK